MKITNFSAENVHGYLPININFHSNLTFLTGLNGSGKTSALRLLMALLTPNIEEFSLISFTRASVVVEDENLILSIIATRESSGLTLEIDSLSEVMEVSSSELQMLADLKRREEARSPLYEKFISHPVFKAINSLSTPMFLGIDRKSFTSITSGEEFPDLRRRAIRLAYEDTQPRGVVSSLTNLSEVNFLVITKMQEIRAEQERLDEDLRRKFFTRAFEYKPSNFQFKGPSRSDLEKYRGQLSNVERAAEGLRLPVPDLQAALAQFIDQMTKVVNSLEKNVKKPGNVVRPRGKKWENPPEIATPPDRDLVEWMINSPQADRIMEHLKLLEGYVESRKALREPIDRFLSLVNNFLKETRKSVAVADTGELRIFIERDLEPRPITALSSGERQLLVMLAHLSLNANLVGSGVFIVDEPELSLHIDWQEKFVDSVIEANPKVQLILATHSPAIILDRVENCWSLSH
ncbi:AAA family ATPase [Variovorax sp.]|jgi:energy-coupling factor transporter ATP-binding protein EcfA2|uniref:AAA family ATPase n=1 Tax=Variovorax sp. TaxID=1871043 RepID=UPI0037DA3B3C